VPESYDELKQEALAVGARLLERYPDALEPIGLLANVHFEVGNLAEATRCWKQCLKRHPDFAEAYYRLGLYARKEGNDKEAVNYLQTAFKLDPTLPDVQAHLGRCLMKLDRVDHALAVLEIEIGASRGGSVRYFFLGHAYLRTQQYDKAKGAFRAAVEITPSFTGAHYGLGTACTKLGQAEEAKKHFEDFRKLKARDAEAVRDKVKQDDVVRMRRIVAAWYYQAGRVYAGEDDLRQAEAHWLRAAAVNSADTKCRQALADLYQRQGKTRQAAELAAEVRSIVARQGN
jgi:tetratricopeptide (TPR) repeat protein